MLDVSSVQLSPLGRVIATPGVLALEIDVMTYINRHVSGDWGDLDDEDKQ